MAKFVIAVLVTARLTRLIMFDNGPRAIIKQVRERLGVENGQWSEGGLIELWNCPWCMATNVAPFSVWLCGVESVGEWVTHSIAASFVAAWLVIMTHRPR